MLLKLNKRPALFSLLQTNTRKALRFGFANKTPFDHKPTQSPFVTPRQTSNWASNNTENVKQVKNIPKAEEPQQQRITPLTANQEKPVVQTQIKPIKQPPPLEFQFLTQKKLFTTKEPDTTITEVANTQPAKQTTQEEIMSDLGLNRYLSRVFATTGISVTISLMAAYAGLFIPNIGEAAQAVVFSLGLLSFGCFQKASQMEFITLSEMKRGEQVVRTKNSLARLALYGTGCISLGFSISPLLYSINEISMNILPLTMGITGAIFGGSSLVGLLLPRGFMLGYGSVLTGGLLGLLALNFTGILAAKYLGLATFAATLSTVESYCGIGLFSAMLMYDTHVAIKRYKAGDADHLGMSIQIFLDVMNLIIRIANQLAKNRKKKE